MNELLSAGQKSVEHNVAGLKGFLSEAVVPGSVCHEVLVDFATIRKTEMKIYNLRKESRRKFQDNGKKIPILMRFELMDMQRNKREQDEIISNKTKESKSYKRAYSTINEAQLYYLNIDRSLTSKLGGLLGIAARIAEPYIPPLI